MKQLIHSDHSFSLYSQALILCPNVSEVKYFPFRLIKPNDHEHFSADEGFGGELFSTAGEGWWWWWWWWPLFIFFCNPFVLTMIFSWWMLELSDGFLLIIVDGMVDGNLTGGLGLDEEVEEEKCLLVTFKWFLNGEIETWEPNALSIDACVCRVDQ